MCKILGVTQTYVYGLKLAAEGSVKMEQVRHGLNNPHDRGRPSLYERGGTIYRDVWTDRRRDRKSLGHSDRKLAEKQGRELARRLAELQHAGQTGAVTFGQLVMLYRQHRIKLLAAYRQQAVRAHLEIIERHLARDRVVDDLSQHDIDSYALARRSGTLESPHKRGQEPGVRDGTIRNELTTLMAVLNWGVVFRLGGRRLIAANPLHGATIPREKNAKRPLATEERYQKLLEVADRAEPEGRLRLLLALARHTGRRINALSNLRASDVLLSRDQMVTALARDRRAHRLGGAVATRGAPLLGEVRQARL